MPDYSQMSDAQLRGLAGGQSLDDIMSPSGGQRSPLALPSDAGAGDKLFKFITQNLPMGLAAGGTALATGGLGPGLMAAGSTMASPPQDAGDAIGLGLGELLNPAYKAASMSKSVLARMGISGAIGAGQREVAGLTHGQQPNVKQLLAQAAMTAAPQAVSALTAPTLENSELQGKLTDAMSKLQKQYPSTQGLPETTLTDLQKSFNKWHYDNAALADVQKDYQAASQKQATLLTKIGGSDDPAELIKANAAILKLAKQSRTPTPETDQINQLDQHINDTLALQRDGKLSESSANATVSLAKRQQAQLSIQRNDRIAAMLQGNASSNLATGLVDNTQVYAALNDTVSKIKEELANNPMENVRLRNLLPAAGQGDPVEGLVTNIGSNQSSQEDVAALYKFLDKLPDGDTRRQQIQSMMVGKFFADAYDPTAKQLANVPQLLSGSGPFNRDKVASIFATKGNDGTDAADKFGAVVQDLKRATEIQAQQTRQSVALQTNFTTPATKAIGYASPLGVMFGMMHGGSPAEIAKGVAGEASTMAIAYAPKMVLAAMQNPVLAKAIHDFSTSGVVNATLANYLQRTAPKYTGKVPDPPPPPPPPPQQGQPSGQSPQQGTPSGALPQGQLPQGQPPPPQGGPPRPPGQ